MKWVFLAIIVAGGYWLEQEYSITSVAMPSETDELALTILAGFLTAVLLATVVLALMTPLFVHSLVNRPDGKKPSGFHLFTFLEEGEAKWIVRGDRPIRAIMLLADHYFAREKNQNDPEHWEIKKGREEASPVGHYSLLNPIGWWAKYVYWLTGAVFTGFYPFQGVRERLIEQTKIPRDDDANITLTEKENISDHLRVREFIFYVWVGRADTLDKISVGVLLAVRARVVNPHKAAFGTDRWDRQMSNLVTSTVTNYTRTRNLENVLSLKDGDKQDELQKKILALKEDNEKYGIDLKGVDVIDISPNLSDEEKKRLYAEALAKPEGEAIAILGKKKAEAVKSMQDVVTSGGDVGLAVLQSENLVRAAEAAKGGTVLIGTGSADPTQAAILAELKKISQGGT